MSPRKKQYQEVKKDVMDWNQDDIFERYLTLLRDPATLRLNSHLDEEELRDLKDGFFPPQKPVFTNLASVKGGEWRAQINLGGKKDFYISHLSTIYHYILEEGYETIKDVLEDYPSPKWQGSHLVSGFPGSERDFNPNNLVFEQDFTNKSRIGCFWRVLKVTGQLAAYEDFKEKLRLEKSKPLATRSTPKPVIAYIKDPFAEGEARGEIHLDSQSLVMSQIFSGIEDHEPLTQAQEHASQISHLSAADTEILSKCACLHDPVCCYWKKEWGNIPENVLLGLKQL